ncbi:hypothetical protein [Actinoalloteichus spitiensis]|uniref:hypothetical protein n=1 Tax=Actinoalloteichus spitiensis TaxID=252394 RepID=UPI000361BBEA|nr:hypothetical protein [Actinoalloteichus spitiensis]
MPTWVWFTAAVVFAMAGAALLATDTAQRSARNRERRRWAALRGWQFAESDQVLPTRWSHGYLAAQNGGVASDVVAGSTFTADGRRQVYVFDHEAGGKAGAVLVAVRCRQQYDVVVELWLPSVPVPQESGLDLLGPVGSRYAFVTQLSAARQLITPDLVEAAEEVGDDVTVVWLEKEWVLAAAPANASPSRLERLLRDVGEIADLIDPVDEEEREQQRTHALTVDQEDERIFRPSSQS